jgi:hypothetical protein
MSKREIIGELHAIHQHNESEMRVGKNGAQVKEPYENETVRKVG